jgi:hypothetical protein
VLKIYSLTLVSWWRSILRWRGQGVPVIVSTPSRAFADMRTLLEIQRGSDGTAQLRGQNIPLPFASLHEGIEEYDGSRDNAGQIRGMYVDQELRRGVNVDWPTPVNLPFQLDIWCETQKQARTLRDLIRDYFKFQVAYLTVDFSSPQWAEDGDEIPLNVSLLGKRRVALKLTGWTDTSNLESDSGDKTVRSTLSMVMAAWMARGFTEVPLVREIRTDVVLASDGSVVQTIVEEPPEIVDNSV